MLCDFGCSREAIKTFKNGKHCCSNTTSSCPSMKLKNGILVKSKRQMLGNQYWKNGHPKGASGGTSLKGKSYENIYGKEVADQRRAHLSSKATGHKNFDKLSHEEKAQHARLARENILRRYESGWLPKAGRCKKN